MVELEMKGANVVGRARKNTSGLKFMKVKVTAIVESKKLVRMYAFTEVSNGDQKVMSEASQPVYQTTLTELREKIEKSKLTNGMDFNFIWRDSSIDRNDETFKISDFYSSETGLFEISIDLVEPITESQPIDKPVVVMVKVGKKVHCIKAKSKNTTLKELRGLIDKKNIVTFDYIFVSNAASIPKDEEDDYLINSLKTQVENNETVPAVDGVETKLVTLQYADDDIEAEDAADEEVKTAERKARREIKPVDTTKLQPNLNEINIPDAGKPTFASTETHQISEKEKAFVTNSDQSATDSKIYRFNYDKNTWNLFLQFPLRNHYHYPIALNLNIGENDAQYKKTDAYKEAFYVVDKDDKKLEDIANCQHKFEPVTDNSDTYKSQVLKTAQDFAHFKSTGKTLSASVEISGAVPGISAGLSSSLSKSSSDRKDTENSESKLYSVGIHVSSKVRLTFKPSEIRINPDYEQKITECKNLKELRELLNEYGAFVACAYEFGGKATVHSVDNFRNSKEASEKEEEFKAALKMEAKYAAVGGGGAGMGVGTKDKEQNTSSTSKAESNYHRTFTGGIDIDGDMSKWKQSLHVENWTIIFYDKIIPYTEFISDETLKYVKRLKEPDGEVKEPSKPVVIPPTIVGRFDDYMLSQFKELLLKAAWHNINKLYHYHDANRDYDEYELALSNLEEHCIKNNLSPRKVHFEAFENVIRLRVEYFKIDATNLHDCVMNPDRVFDEITQNVKSRNYSWFMPPSLAEISRDKREDYLKEKEWVKTFMGFQPLKLNEHFSDDVIKNINIMINHICWHVVNVRRNNDVDANSNKKLFDEYGNKLKAG